MRAGVTAAADSDSGEDAPPSLALRVVMLSGGALAALALTGISAVLPAIDAALAHGPHDSLLVKQLIGAVALTMVLGAPLGGFLIDRLGLRRMLLATALLYAVAGMSGLYLSSLSLLVVSRMGIGLAAGALQVISLTVINTRLAGADRAKWMGIHISLAMLAALAVHPISGLLGNFGWRWPFALYAVGLLMVPVALVQRDTRAGQPGAAHVLAAELAGGRRSLLAVFPYHYVPFAIAIGSIVFIPTVYVPFRLRELGMSTPLLISLVLTADSIAGTIMAMLYGRARRHLSTHGAFAVSFASATIGMLIAATATGIGSFIAGFMIYGVGVGWLIANLMTALADKVALDQQGRAAGLVKAAHFSAAPLGIMIVEPFARRHGPQVALLITGGLALGLLVLIRLRRRFTQQPVLNPAGTP